MTGLRTDEFDYTLPPELIATHPAARRDESRMLVVNRASGQIEHARFREFEQHIAPEDLVVFNDTRVVPARFYSNDGRVELLRVEELSPTLWRCMVKPGKRMKTGHTIQIGDATGTVEQVLEEDGHRIVRFDQEVDSVAHGHLALPPYMGREDESADQERYQTVFGSRAGAIAAPTAGLHFTPELVGRLPHAFVTLHVGVGTFLPVKAEHVTEHTMHVERYELPPATTDAIQQARRVTAVGTTVVRVLEHCARGGLPLQPGRGETDIFIYPPYPFRVVDQLLTNFHLPKSTLLMLVSAMAGKDLIMEAYAKAIEERYRFYSYGDCMLIL